MQRTIILVLAVLVLLLGGALAYMLLRGASGPVPVSIEAGGETAPNLYRAEMACIDRVLQRHDMDSNQAQAAMDDCRASGQPGNRSAGQ
jgi:hypothetical protein